MLVRKLRLKQGWSQEQLAELVGVSTRTIQRLEQNHRPSLETAKALSSVFEVELSTFIPEEKNMNMNDNNVNEPNLAQDEKEALEYVKGIKEFFTHVLIFAVMLIVYGGAIMTGKIAEDRLTFLVLASAGWGIGVFIHGLIAFEKIRLGWLKWFGPSWEKALVEKRLGRKL